MPALILQRCFAITDETAGRDYTITGRQTLFNVRFRQMLAYEIIHQSGDTTALDDNFIQTIE
jgi:hypothetical protein